MIAALPLSALDPPWLRDPLYRIARRVPAADWRFAERLALVDVFGRPFDLTRTTGRTVTGQDGSTQSLAVNVPAYQFQAGRCLGLDLQPARSNVFLNPGTPATQTCTVTAAPWTLSFSGTGTITLTGASTAGPLVGAGANRVALTFTPSAGALILTLSGSIIEPQLELGENMSPFIPNAGSIISRTADIATAVNIGWINQAEFTVFLQATATGGNAGTNYAAFSLDDGTIGNRIQIGWRGNNAAARVVVSAGGSAITNVNFSASSSWPAQSERRVVLAFRVGDCAGGVSGGSISSIAIPTLPSVCSQISVGSGPGLAAFGGPVARLTIINGRLPDSTLQALIA